MKELQEARARFIAADAKCVGGDEDWDEIERSDAYVEWLEAVRAFNEGCR